MNKITLIGNLTKKPESYEKNGTVSANFTLAVNRRFKVSNETITDFFSIWVRGASAESCLKYLDKGKKVAVIGEFQFKEYEKRDGTKAYSLNVAADEVEFLTPKSETKESFVETNEPDCPWE